MKKNKALDKNKKKYILAAAVVVLAAGLVCAGLWLTGFFRKNDSGDINSNSDINDTIVITHLRTCGLENPIGLDEETPYFSWRMEGEGRGLSQSAYQIVAASSTEKLSQGEYVWNSGKVEASESVGISYGGDKLAAKSRYYWQVSVWNQDGELFTSTEEAFFETGLMGGKMEGAKWISAQESSEAEGSGEKEEYGEEAYIYNIKYDTYVANTEAGFVFGASGGRYGDMYLCSIKNGGEGAFLSLRKMSGGVLEEEPLKVSMANSESTANGESTANSESTANGEETANSEGTENDKGAEAGGWLDITKLRDEENESRFLTELSIEKEKLTVSINGVEAGSYIIEPSSCGAVGAYKSRSVSYAYLDNLMITDGSGNILCEEDFEGEENIFEPYYTYTKEGRLRIGSGLVLNEYKEEAAPYFYKEFELEAKEIESARIYMTALGSFELICNGQKVSDEYFAPGKLAYNEELTYVSYDVTKLLKAGESNALGIILAHGWYDRAVGYPEIWNPWGDTNALLGMLEVRYKDGTARTIVTDESFFCSVDTPVRFDDIYQGEFYDAAFEQEGFGEAGFSHEGWQSAAVDAVDTDYYKLPLRGRENEPIRCVEELTPVSVDEPCENVFVYDFGQNFAGTCKLKLRGEKGQVVTLRYGEIVNTEDMDNRDDEVGCIWTQNLLTAQATDYYVLKGEPEGEEVCFEFTYHGFRYLQLTGLDEAPELTDIKGLVLSSDLERSGYFECSDELLNSYYENSLWSQRSNFMDNPTDCPQRDERHGWAGDAQIFSLTASYNMDTYNFYRKYLRELRLLQDENGAFPDMAPRNFGTDLKGRGGSSGNNCWGDAAAVITWNLYTQYGNKAVIEENYPALQKWMEFLVNTSEDYIRSYGGYGDHLSSEDTPAEVSDTAWCARCAYLLSKMAAVLENDEDSKYYSVLYENYKAAWQRAYVSADGVTSCDTQTSYALGLAFDLFPEELKGKAAERLNLLAEYSGYHINAGYSGIGYILPALSENGYNGTAYKFILQNEYPSLLYQIQGGATTTYESMSAYTRSEDGFCHYSGSLNHYAYGSPVSWLYTNVLGIKSDEASPGFHHIILKPQPDEALSYAKGSYESVYGEIRVEWEKSESGYAFRIVIPPNTSAGLTLPETDASQSYAESGMSIEDAQGVSYAGSAKNEFLLESGEYCFELRQE